MRQNIFSILALLISLSSLFVGQMERMDNMKFSELLEKMVKGETLTPAEQQQVVLEARRLEETALLLNKIIIPGTSSLRVDHAEINNADINTAEIDDAEIVNATITDAEIVNATITDAVIASATAGGGDVIIDSTGVSIANNAEGVFSIKDASGNRNTLYLLADEENRLYIVNANAPDNPSEAGIWQRIKLTDGSSVEAVFIEDPNQDNRPFWRIQDGAQGIRWALGNNALIDFRTEGASGGSTFMRMLETATTPPAGSTDAFHMYMKGDKLIIQFDAAGTPHYFYLNLTATTNQSWIYSATAP